MKMHQSLYHVYRKSEKFHFRPNMALIFNYIIQFQNGHNLMDLFQKSYFFGTINLYIKSKFLAPISAHFEYVVKIL